jgi:hypothetical protein
LKAQPKARCDVLDETHFVSGVEVTGYDALDDAVIRLLYLTPRGCCEAKAIPYELRSKSPRDGRYHGHQGASLEPLDRFRETIDEFEVFQLPTHIVPSTSLIENRIPFGYLGIGDPTFGILALQFRHAIVAHPRSEVQAHRRVR